ncbi:MAG: hypothetical protein AAGA60_31800 [Cyanobacteria bacterium P01_E01_bin.42]
MPQILEYARFLDELPEAEGFVQNSDPIQHLRFEVMSPKDPSSNISEILSFPQSLWEEADRQVDAALAGDLKGLSEKELQQFILLLAEKIFKGES